jgi:hypothetical protein
MWSVESDTDKLLRGLLTESSTSVPPRTQRLGAAEVSWWEGKPGDAVVMASGGSSEDRSLAERVVAAQLEGCGYKRARFVFDSMTKEAGWPDIMQKAKRLIQSGQVTILRNGWNNIVGHVIGDHGEYNTEIGRDDPESRTITTWQCECPWDQYAWQRTRKWKKYEGRPCAHVMALYWKALATPLDDYDPNEHGPLNPGQKGGPPAPPGPAMPTGMPQGQPEMPKQPEIPGMPSPIETQGPQELAPPGPSNILPTPPMDQLAQMQPPIPGATPGGMPANPSVVSVPGAKMPTPFNPIQFPGGTYSKISAEEFVPPEIVRLKEDCYGLAEGKSEDHGAGNYRIVPAGTSGEVLAQDATTGWVEIIFPIDDASYLEPYHVKCYVEPSDLVHSRQKPPGPFIKRK